MSATYPKQEGLRASDSDEMNEKYDAEQGRRDSHTMVGGRKMSRIGPVTIGPAADVDSHGALVEAEAENAIKYRTCSWQKVKQTPPHQISTFTSSTRRRTPLARLWDNDNPYDLGQ